jgi:hypothetical protein
MTEYLLFVHGVNTREDRYQPDYAEPLLQQIQHLAHSQMTIKPIVLYWGDVNINEEMELLKMFQASSVWDKLCFPDLRAKQLLQFTGDAALYISRTGGKLIADRLVRDTMSGLQDFRSGTDHLHLITHSMGTVILFDMLFSSRWDAPKAGGYEGVEQLRHQIFREGSPVRSIHTMGSPIGLFSLLMGGVGSTNLPDTHDITTRLKEYLQNLCGEAHTPFPWRNYLHPMDPVATPIEQLLPDMLGTNNTCLDVRDLLTQEADLLSQATNFSLRSLGELGGKLETAQLVLFGGLAHNSYWANPFVAATILQTIETTARQPLLL